MYNNIIITRSFAVERMVMLLSMKHDFTSAATETPFCPLHIVIIKVDNVIKQEGTFLKSSFIVLANQLEPTFHTNPVNANPASREHTTLTGQMALFFSFVYKRCSSPLSLFSTRQKGRHTKLLVHKTFSVNNALISRFRVRRAFSSV